MQLIGYIRVSTAKQGESGLGLEAQLSAIDQYSKLNNGVVIAMYREIESGTKDRRPELEKAIKHARRSKARLVIAKLDRLSRNIHFVSGLMQSGVDFVATDNPHANKLTIHILAVIAENEAAMISQRVKAALTAAKARGTLLGSSRPGHWKGREHRRIAGLKKATEAARMMRQVNNSVTYAGVKPIMKQMREEGASLRSIAEKLNSGGHTTVTGLPWNPMQVGRVLTR